MDLNSKEIFEANCLTHTFTGNVYLRYSSMGLLSLIAQFRLLVVELDEHLACSWWLVDTEVTNNYFFLILDGLDVLCGVDRDLFFVVFWWCKWWFRYLFMEMLMILWCSLEIGGIVRGFVFLEERHSICVWDFKPPFIDWWKVYYLKNRSNMHKHVQPSTTHHPLVSIPSFAMLRPGAPRRRCVLTKLRSNAA